jgi:signal transduction histidine kinase
MISGVLFLVFFMQYMVITLEMNGLKPDLDGQHETSPVEIQRRLVDFMVFSIVIGTAGGFVIGRIVIHPINHLSEAAHMLARGELNIRAPIQGSQEIRDLATTFNSMAEALQLAETQRQKLMADISHELRTPLTVLEGNLRAALDHIYTLDEVEITNLYHQTTYLSRLVNDIHELSLADASQLHLEKILTDLNATIVETIQALEPLADEKKISLLNQTPVYPLLNIDPTRIRQVLINLLINAIRHTPTNGQITIIGEVNEGELVVSVKDNGDGLSEDQINAIFKRFYRGDKSRNRETGGTGLGLPITKAIVEAHSGRISVYSAGCNKGSVFTVILPINNHIPHNFN